jgi:hypothetical protein
MITNIIINSRLPPPPLFFYLRTQSVFVAISILMGCAGCLQLSFMSRQEWTMIHRKSIHHARSLSITATNMVWSLEESNKLKDE